MFNSAGVNVLSPKLSTIVDPSEWFVRLGTDCTDQGPAEIQLRALHRILRSDFVYVYNPRGRIGRTTSYEIGRLHERGIPLYFRSKPRDLPIEVPPSAIVTPLKLVGHIQRHQELPNILASELPAQIRQLHDQLLRGEYVD